MLKKKKKRKKHKPDQLSIDCLANHLSGYKTILESRVCTLLPICVSGFAKTWHNNIPFSPSREERTGNKVVDLVEVGGRRLSPWIGDDEGKEIETPTSGREGADKRKRKNREEKKGGKTRARGGERGRAAVGETGRVEERGTEQREAGGKKEGRKKKTRSSHMTGIDCGQD